jgi:DnaK suppressor protein
LDVDPNAPLENEDAFSDMPQEPERFSPVPMASRLQRPSVRYSDKDLAEFRIHIEAERKKAMEEFQMLRENLDDLTNSEMADENASYSMHMAEQGTDAQEKEKLYAHVQRVSDYVKKLDEALQRIGDKVYGICKMCGILIAKERLLAVPITTQSASYKLRKRCPEDGIDRIVPVRK